MPTTTNGHTFYVDEADLELVRRHTWLAEKHNGVWYVKTYVRRRRKYLHRLIMNEPEGLQIDHRDGDGLNNRRANLRVATESQNKCNRGRYRCSKTGHKGVFVTKRGRFYAKVGKDRKQHHLGYFDTAEAASVAYQKAARNLHGEFFHE